MNDFTDQPFLLLLLFLFFLTLCPLIVCHSSNSYSDLGVLCYTIQYYTMPCHAILEL